MSLEVVKMYCIFAKESVDKMGGVRGKLASQAGHAYLHSALDAQERFPAHFKAYWGSGKAYKITLVVATVEELKKFEDAYRNVCGVSLVTDAGYTVFKDEHGNPCPVVTCLGIGPLPDNLKGFDLLELKTLT